MVLLKGSYMSMCYDCRRKIPDNCEGCQCNEKEILSKKNLEVLEKQQFNDSYNGKFDIIPKKNLNLLEA
jgi:hypothetical protein